MTARALPLLSLLLATTPARADAPLPPPTGARPAPGEAPAPPALQRVDIVEHLGDALPDDLTFNDHAGRPVRLAALWGHGRPLLLALAWYRCPMLCPMVLAGAARALPFDGAWQLGRDFDAVTVSFAAGETPRDAAARRREHLAALGSPASVALGTDPADDRLWPFLVGSEAAIGRLAGALGFRFARDPATGQYAHAAALFVITPDGRISRYLYGVQASARDLRLALAEAAGGRVGPSIDWVLLTCYRYDPASRRYGFFLASFLRLGGLAVFLALAAVLMALWRHDLRRQRLARDAAAEHAGRPS